MGLFMDWKLHIVFGWAFFDFILSVLYGYFFLHLVQASKLLLLNKWEVIKVTDVLNSVGVKNRSIKERMFSEQFMELWNLLKNIWYKM